MDSAQPLTRVATAPAILLSVSVNVLGKRRADTLDLDDDDAQPDPKRAKGCSVLGVEHDGDGNKENVPPFAARSLSTTPAARRPAAALYRRTSTGNAPTRLRRHASYTHTAASPSPSALRPPGGDWTSAGHDGQSALS